MSTAMPATPFLDHDSPLDEAERDIVERLVSADEQKMINLPTDSPSDPKRFERVRLMGEEMFDQPAAITATCRSQAEGVRRVAAELARRRPRRIMLTGAGDSLAVLISARGLLEEMVGVPCEPVQSLELAYYAARRLDVGAYVIAISSSGETPRTVEAVLAAEHAGARTLALTNTPGSTLAQLSGDALLIQASRRGWPTQSSTAALALLLRIALEIGKQRQCAGTAELESQLDRIPEMIQDALLGLSQPIADIASAEAHRGMYLFTGAGPNWGSALIGAAKIKEATPNHAAAVHLEEFHHYNSQKAGDPLWLLVPPGPSLPRAVDTMRQCARAGGQSYLVTSESAGDVRADVVLRLPDMDELLSSVVYSVPAQLFGYHVAMAKFEAARGSRP